MNFNIALLSDTHYGFSNFANEQNVNLLKELKEDHNPQVICHAGDISSSCTRELEEYFSIVRSIFPDTPVFAVLGNHDHWESEKTYHNVQEKLDDIASIFNKYDIAHVGSQLLENDHIGIIGLDNWYKYNHFTSNDRNFIPLYNTPGEGFEFLTARSHEMFKFCLGLKKSLLSEKKKIIFMSHFNFVPQFASSDPRSYYDADSYMAEGLEGVDYFFFGHTHGKTISGEVYEKTGTLCYNPGSNYSFPKYQIISINS